MFYITLRLYGGIMYYNEIESKRFGEGDNYNETKVDADKYNFRYILILLCKRFVIVLYNLAKNRV